MGNNLVSRLGSEALGTLFFVFLGSSAVVAATIGVQETEMGPVPILNNLTVALGWALALAIAVWIFSAGGGHLNPWVTIAMALRGKLDWLAVPGHLIAQLVGGFLGALLTWGIYEKVDGSGAFAATHLSERFDGGADYIGVLAAEALVTFVLLAVVFHLIGKGGWKYGLGYGLTYGLGVLAIGAATGSSLNFARTFGGELTATIAGKNLAEWGDIWVYLVGPAVGVVLAWIVYPLFTRSSDDTASSDDT